MRLHQHRIAMQPGTLARGAVIMLTLAIGVSLVTVKAAKDDGRLPMEDHNIRLIVVGRDGTQAQAVAEAIAKEAFHNVAYFGGTFDTLMQKTAGR
jgi:rhodanese-related sulfurtransferase